MKKSSEPQTPVEKSPVYWFSILDQAIEKGDLEMAAEGQRELERLGVYVEYRLRRVECPQSTEASPRRQK
jgi:hypothetical protein